MCMFGVLCNIRMFSNFKEKHQCLSHQLPHTASESGNLLIDFMLQCP